MTAYRTCSHFCSLQEFGSPIAPSELGSIVESLASEVGCNREHESNQEGDSESKDNEDDYVIDGTVKVRRPAAF